MEYKRHDPFFTQNLRLTIGASHDNKKPHLLLLMKKTSCNQAKKKKPTPPF